MLYFDVNYLAVIVSAIASIALGMFWYGPFGFGKPWMKEMGIDPSKMKSKKMGKDEKNSYMVGMIIALITAFVLASLISSLRIASIGPALKLAFFLWLGFSATVQLNNVIWGKKSMLLWKIETGYQLANLLIAATILVTWQ